MALSLLLSGCSLTVGPTTMVAPSTTVAPSASVGMTEVEGTTTQPPTTTPTSGSSTVPDWEALSRSVVSIHVYHCGGSSWSGSGTIVLDGSYILTNAHVVADDAGNFCDLLILASYSASELPDWIADARVIPEAYDSDLDLAVLRLVDINGQPFLATGRDPVEIKDVVLGLGDEIKVLGYPGLGGDTITMTGGEISGWTSDAGRNFYKSSARSGPGISGGAAFDTTTGEYVGTPTGGIRTSGDVGEALVLIRPSSSALPLLQAAQQADLPPAPGTLATNRVRVLVANGSGISGAGGKVTDILSPGGWTMLSPANADKTATTRIYYRDTYADAAQAIAETLGGDFDLLAQMPPGGPAVPAKAEDRVANADIVVVLGSDQRLYYEAPVVPTTTTTTQPPVTTVPAPIDVNPTTTVPPPGTTAGMFGNLGPELMAMLLGQPCIADGDLSDCGPEVDDLVRGLVGE